MKQNVIFKKRLSIKIVASSNFCLTPKDNAALFRRKLELYRKSKNSLTCLKGASLLTRKLLYAGNLNFLLIARNVVLAKCCLKVVSEIILVLLSYFFFLSTSSTLSVWPDLAKFRHFGKFQIFGYFWLNTEPTLANFLCYWANLIIANVQILKN